MRLTITRAGAEPLTIDLPATGGDIAVRPDPPVDPTLPPCTFAVTPLTLTADVAGGQGLIAVTRSRPDCVPPAPTSDVDWITTFPGSGDGVILSIGANEDSFAARTGTATVAGQRVTVTQHGLIQPPTGGVIARLRDFEAMPANANHTRRTLPGQAPGGTDAVEFTQIARTSTQYYMGWRLMNGPNPAIPVRYLRGEIFVPGPPYHGKFDAKFIIFGEGGDGNRMIAELRDDGRSASTLGIRATKNIDGGGPHVPFVLGRWNFYQIEVNANGPVKVWVNNNVYASPNAQSPTKTFATTLWGNIGLGYYAGSRQASPEGVMAYRHGDFEVATSFDPTWAK